MSDAMQILNEVREFYETAWTHLIWFLAVLGFIGAIAVPIIIQVVQTRRFKEQDKKLREDLSTDLKAELKVLLAEAKQELTDAIQKSAEAKITEATASIKATSDAAMGSIFFLQGNQNNDEKKYASAVEDYYSAIPYFLAADDQRNAHAVLQNLMKTTLVGLTKEDFVDKPEIDEYLSVLIKGLEKQGKGWDYDVEQLTKGISAAKKRAKKE